MKNHSAGKTLRLLIVATIVSIIFTACSVKDQFKDDPDLSSLTGIIKEQSDADKELGSHLLLGEENKKTALRSLAINLSSVRYLNNKVEVIGFMNEDDNVFEVTGISVVEILSEERERLAEFVEYKNLELGFSIKYYNNWVMSEASNSVSFFAPAETEPGSDIVTTNLDKVVISQEVFEYVPTVSETDGSTDTALAAYFEENRPEVTSLESLMHQIGIDKLDAVKIEQKNGDTEYFLYRFGLIYRVEFIPATTPASSKNKESFNEMLAEFRFTVMDEVDDVSDGESGGDTADGDESDSGLPELDLTLTTFESLPYHFSGKYPASWYYAGKSGLSGGVLHHYGFSDESVTDENEIISLDVLSTEIPSGEKLTVGSKEFTTVQSGNNYTVYLTIGERNYKLSGDEAYKDLILVMADSISPVDNEDEE